MLVLTHQEEVGPGTRGQRGDDPEEPRGGVGDTFMTEVPLESFLS